MYFQELLMFQIHLCNTDTIDNSLFWLIEKSDWGSGHQAPARDAWRLIPDAYKKSNTVIVYVK